MKNGCYLRFTLVLGLLLAPATAPAAITPSVPAYTFKFAGYYPPASPQAKASEQYFMNRVKQLSHGRVKWQYFPSEQLGKGTEQLDIVGGGTAEFGALIPAFFTGKVPLLGSQDLPFLFNTDVAGHIRIATALLHQPEITDAMAKSNVKIVAASSLGTMSMFFKRPLKTLEDWKGRKVRYH
jgi:TRAP-type C4-dicarboxylate transport system substrate-binding protein